MTDKQGQLREVFDSLVDLALRVADKKNTSGMGLDILPALLSEITELFDRL